MQWLKRLWAWITCKELTVRPTDEEIQANANKKIEEQRPRERFIKVREVNFDLPKSDSTEIPAGIEKMLRESRVAASQLDKKDLLSDSEYMTRRRKLQEQADEQDRQRRSRQDSQRQDDSFTNGLLIGAMVSQPTYSEPTRSTSSWCGGSSSSSDSYSSSSSDSGSSSSCD